MGKPLDFLIDSRYWVAREIELGQRVCRKAWMRDYIEFIILAVYIYILSLRAKNLEISQTDLKTIKDEYLNNKR